MAKAERGTMGCGARTTALRTIPVAALALGSTVGLAGSAAAGEIGHYSAALADIRDYVMPAQPGFYFKEYTFYYTSDSFYDRHGNKASNIDLPFGGSVDIDVDVDIFVLAPTFMWVSDWEILGAHYGAFIIPTFGNSSVDASLTTLRGLGAGSDESDFGIGDMYVQPLWLGWTREHWDFALGYGFYAPIGEFEQGATDNIGLGFWTHQAQAAIAWYPDAKRGTAFVAAVTYEYNQDVEGADLTPGQRINANLGIDQLVPLGGSGFVLELGAGIYGQWQISDDTGSDAVNSDVHDQVFGAGPQLGLIYVLWGAAATAKWQHEFEAENRFKGDNFTLNFAVAF
jgi:hypothetical protein